MERMTVKELIEKLNELEGDRKIYFMDSEDGRVEPGDIEEEIILKATKDGDVYVDEFYEQDLVEKGYKILDRIKIYVVR